MRSTYLPSTSLGCSMGRSAILTVLTGRGKLRWLEKMSSALSNCYRKTDASAIGFTAFTDQWTEHT